jgi:disulfide bond formation protein DsbB
VLVLLLALSGAASALYQTCGIESASCSLTFADKRSAPGTRRRIRHFFRSPPTALTLQWLLGIQYAYWSLALFVMLAAASILVVASKPRRRY